MFGLPLAFAAPLVLGALAALPVLWYLLRITPPRPRQIAFPPLRLILDLEPKDQQPARTPWWLLALRLLLAALIILAMAGPIWNPPPRGQAGSGPLVVVLDNGWPAALDWDKRLAAANDAIVSAAREGRASAVLATSEAARDVLPADPSRLTERLRALKPVPHAPDRKSALAPITKFVAANPGADILWISDGIDQGDTRAFAEGLIAAAGEKSSVRMLTGARSPVAITNVENAPAALDARLVRAGAGGSENGVMRAYDLKGLSIGETRFTFAGANETTARLDLPTELRNEIARLEIENERTAGAVALLDSRWKRRRVAIVSGVTADLAQPLLSPSYYVSRALAPFAEVREPRAGTRDPIIAALDEQPSLIVLTDVGVISGLARDRLTRFIEEGGVLLRFAGTRLASGANDDLTPVRLRRGGRVLGGSLSWDTPRKLSAFDRSSPFSGIDISEEVSVTRQVLAEPEAGLVTKTWAALDDGTPLITADRRGKGLIALVHVTADTTWSNLPLSGLFVNMLRRMVALAGETTEGPATGTSNTPGASRAETIAPTRTLDGFGILGEPPVTAKPILVNFGGPSTPDHPPGFYGPPDAMVAINTLAPDAKLSVPNFDGLKLDMQALRPAEPVDLRPSLIALAFLLFLADALATLWLGGVGRRGKTTATPARAAIASSLVACLVVVLSAHNAPAFAQSAAPANPVLNQKMIEAALTTRLAYVVTGDSQIDEASRLGLTTLSRALGQRTALSPGEPMGVDPGRDELAFFPIIYWPIAANQPLPAQATATRISEFMKNGGTVIFDTRDALTQRPGGPPTPETAWLRRLLAGVDVPELEPIPRDHVVTKTFYLLETIVGRTTVGQTWIEAMPASVEEISQRPARAGDSVSPIIITSNDLASAWASDRSGQPLYPLQPGTGRQREMAIRGGVNIVMYALTGNYKADQVHVRDLLDRLGL
ncbi:MAG: DUF4159 domain-containing protein [Beijerinckiaceae bacterium]|nr:DUF4159 domain-containing protein [Beijerinckiaceae bacterium]